MKPRIGFFSDVHSNIWAMEAIAQIIKARQEGWIWASGGDAVGWLYDPIKVVDMLRSMRAQGLIKCAVIGNHDLLAMNTYQDFADQDARLRATPYSGGAVAASPLALSFLASLPLTWDLKGEADCIIAHHTPFGLPSSAFDTKKEDWLYLPQDFDQQLENWVVSEHGVILSGHDHNPAVHVIESGLVNPVLDDVVTHIPGEDELHVPIEPGKKYWVQNGATGGPPRDCRTGLNWVELRPGEEIILHRDPYDTDELKALIESQPFGSLLTWKDFRQTKNTGAHGGTVINH